MKVPPFKLDHWLAAHEFADPPIRFNLASSTGPTWTLGEIGALGGGDVRKLDEIRLSYAPPQGAQLLRERIAAVHGVEPECVLVMTGASEALIALTYLFAEPKASIVVPEPCYPAVPVLARAWGLRVNSYRLESALGFAQSADTVLAAVDSGTRAVFVNTPHNPTGSTMPVAEQRALAQQLDARGIPLIVDEVYFPLFLGPLDFREAVPSASALPNTIVIGDFAKALSLPGLRVGWLIERDTQRRETLLDLRSYFTISGSPLTEAIAAHAFANRAAILERLETVARANLALLTRFMERHAGTLAWAPPTGGTTCFPWLRDGRDSRPLCAALAKAGVLVAPGDCFEAPAHMRIGFGAQRGGYDEALAIFSRVLAEF